MCHKCEDFLFLVPWTLTAAHSRHAVDFVKWKNISCPICIYKLFVKSFLTLTWIIWNLKKSFWKKKKKKSFCPRILNLALFIESSLIQMHLQCILCARHGTAMACSLEPALPSTQVDPVLTNTPGASPPSSVCGWLEGSAWSGYRLPRWLSSTESAWGTGDERDVGSSPGDEDPLEKEMQATPVFLPGESHGQKSLAGHSPTIAKSQTRLPRLSVHTRVVRVRGPPAGRFGRRGFQVVCCSALAGPWMLCACCSFCPRALGLSLGLSSSPSQTEKGSCFGEFLSEHSVPRHPVNYDSALCL